MATRQHASDLRAVSIVAAAASSADRQLASMGPLEIVRAVTALADLRRRARQEVLFRGGVGVMTAEA